MRVVHRFTISALDGAVAIDGRRWAPREEADNDAASRSREADTFNDAALRRRLLAHDAVYDEPVYDEPDDDYDSFNDGGDSDSFDGGGGDANPQLSTLNPKPSTLNPQPSGKGLDSIPVVIFNNGTPQP